ncbi:hypothetical protein [Flavobacterium salmonis]|uniref:Sulfatase n=1 Tax=Flavobacterium salmonis TaxID=2654844 RepID=A0A6V6Z2D5_9FLAO|nr:hypothetical protein [Flavobacterium salmonis]CAD0005957.1 hypothetical protein FLAT13_03076 [Flavobacterium salmonis]
MNIKEKFDGFINNDKDYPFLVGFLSGFYPLVFFYSNNFEDINSLRHVVYFSFLFLILPSISIFLLYHLFIRFKKLQLYRKHFLFVVVVELTAAYFSQVYFLTIKKKLLLGLLVFVCFISLKLYKHYKKIIVFILLLSVIPVLKVSEIIWGNLRNSASWQQQPDYILNTSFKKKPNVYYIEPDGYASNENLKGILYRFDNSEFDEWLKEKKFTLYNDFRSNYESTLTSNSSCFFMKHHYYNINSNFKYSRDLITGKNPVLKIFKKNTYKTFFLTESPYLLANSPNVEYDYCNFNSDEVPYFNVFESKRNLLSDLKHQILKNRGTNNFFFIEKFAPNHISVYKQQSLGIEKERISYIKRLREANKWLKETVSFIEKNDSNAIIIIGADHGGFVGFSHTLEASKKISDKVLLKSIFGAKLAIKWNTSQYIEYDSKLKSSVNLFRVLFSFLSEDKELLKNLQPDKSYNLYQPNDFSKIYIAIE